MNIEDIFPEIYRQVNEDKSTFTPEIVAKNIYESPYFEQIKDKVYKINADVSNYNAKVEGKGDVVRKLIYNGFLYHGSPSSNLGELKYLEFQERDEPKDTNIFIHNYVNHLAKKKYGVNVRSGMFVTAQVRSAKSYGSPYLIFPLGEYKIFYSKGVMDFTDEYSTANHGEFGAHFTSYMLGHLIGEMEENRTFSNNIEGSANDFFGHVDGELGDEQFKTFKAFKQRVIEESEEHLKEVILNNDKFDRVLNSIKRTLGIVVNNYMSDIERYVERIEYTKDPLELNKNEGMIFFKNAYAIHMESEFIVNVFLELIELI